MEAQYALQKKKPLIPLKLTQGYEADGWLGLLLGTLLWYAFYGEALSSESAFELRLDSLCRELGGRGRADAVGDAVAELAAREPNVVPAVTETASVVSGPSGLRAELEAMRMGSLCVRAARAGVDAAALDAAEDSPDPKAAIIQLILVEEALLAM